MSDIELEQDNGSKSQASDKKTLSLCVLFWKTQ